MAETPYTCFKFNENSYFDKFVGPAYKEDMYYDKKLDNGLYASNSVKKQIKTYKINGQIKRDDVLGPVEQFWYNPQTSVVYDIEFDIPIGKVTKEHGIARKVDAKTYLIEDVIQIPTSKHI